jgi:hypothetical protein
MIIDGFSAPCFIVSSAITERVPDPLEFHSSGVKLPYPGLRIDFAFYHLL